MSGACAARRLPAAPALAAALLLSACAATTLPPVWRDTPVLLLGELHDNPDGQARRAALVAERVNADGWRPAIAMEQFDRERQPELDRAMQDCADPDCVIARAAPDRTGWTWSFYRPVISLALQHRLPLVAANVSRRDASRVLREGFGAAFDPALIAAYGLDRPLPADLADGQRREIEAGHCGHLPADLAPGMVRAQVARDVWMAEVVRRHAARGVVLLAGNGHVRRDLGVPRWLPAGLPALSVGFGEQAAAAGAYDVELRVPVHPRADPCAALQGLSRRSGPNSAG